MRIVVILILIIFNIIMQSTALHLLSINGIIPNTTLILTISYGIFKGDIAGGIFGFFAGILLDILYGPALGLYGILGFFAGYLCGKPFKSFYKSNIFLPIFLVFISTFVYECSFYFLAFLFRGKVDLLFYMYTIIIPEAIYNTLATAIIYPIFYLLNKMIEAYEKPRRKIFNSIGGLNENDN